MGVLRDTVDHVFRAASTVNLKTVAAKVADAQAALLLAEQAHAAGVLTAALSDDPVQLDKIEADLAAAQRRVATYEAALAEASKIEKQRLGKAKLDADRARLRGLQQHVSAFAKSSEKLTAGLDMAMEGYVEGLKTVHRLDTALSGPERRYLYADTNVETMFHKMVQVEFARVCSPRPGSVPKNQPDFPGADRRAPHGLPFPASVNDAPPLADRIRAKFDIAALASFVPVGVLEGRLGAQSVTEPREQPADDRPAFDPRIHAPEETAVLAALARAAAGEPDPTIPQLSADTGQLADEPVELSADDLAAVSEAQAGHEKAQAAGAEVSSVRLEQNWHHAKVKHDGR